jgi:nitrogen-specific signal transduction histidine kinase
VAFSPSSVAVAHLVPPVATILLTSLLAVWVFQRRWDVRGARTFVLLLLVGAFGWQALTLVHVLGTGEALLRQVAIADKLAGMLATTLFVVFVSLYTNTGYHRWPVVRAGIAVQLGGFLLLWATNPLHGLFVSGISVTGAPFIYAGIQRGPLYYILLGVTYALLALSYYYMIDFLLTTRDDARWQVALLMLGAASVGTLNTLSIVEVVPLQGFNYGSYGSLPFAVFTTVSIFRLGLLDIVPVARKTLVETLPDPVLVVDEDGRVADYNRAAADLWPDVVDHVGDPLEAACPDLAGHLAFPDGGETVTDSVSLPDRPGGKHFSVLISPVQKERRGDVVGHSVLVRDVTELEASRRELERQNERLDRVAGTISHDLRNPLNVAGGRLELLSEVVDADDERVADHLTSIERAHDRMGEIIDDVLTLAREGRDADEFEAVDIEAAAREAWATVDTGTATIEVSITGTIWADRSSLLTVFENLFRNSIEHGPASERPGATGGPARERTDGGTTTIRIGAVEDGFYVADDGPGVPADQRDQVFDHGYTTSEDGTGFGLAIVETVAETHGWTVDLEESATGGARFVFRGTWIEDGAD